MPLQAWLGPLGVPGQTAHAGPLHIAGLKQGETVFVSAAAGAVGSMAVQIAKIKGARVIGSVGTEDKARWVRDELGADAVINYRTAGDLDQGARQGRAAGHRRLFRQCRRRSSRRRAGRRQQVRPLRHLRNDRAIQ